MAGLSRGARTVGWAMRALPDDHRVAGHSVPWHRVINAQGRISPRGGPEGLAERGQATLLRREGVRVSTGGAVDLKRYRWCGIRPRIARW